MASSTLPPPLVLLVSVISSLLLLRIFPCGQSVSTLGVGSISRILEIQDRERAPASLQVAAARGVLRRLLPSHSSSFEFRIVSKILLLGGTGKDGKKKLIGWLSKASTCH
ncbi:hypothetical protein LINPERHAP1_LOCUS14155 [Linum perenne]